MSSPSLYKHTNGLIQWSKDGKHVAIAKDNRLAIRYPTTLQLHHVYSCLDIIQHIQWSADSEYILVAMFKRNMVQVFSISDASWACKISEGIAGMVYATWTPDSRHIITVADFQMYLTIWSLAKRSTSFTIKHPKLGAEGIAFSSDGSILAVAERHDCKDFIGIYKCSTWELFAHFPVNTYDLSEISWSPTDGTILVRDAYLDYNISFYSYNGQLEGNLKAYTGALGVKTASWSPCGSLVAAGSFDQCIRIMNSTTWKSIMVLHHQQDPDITDSKEFMGYREVEDELRSLDKENLLRNPDHIDKSLQKKRVGRWMVIRNKVPTMPIIAPDSTQTLPRHGVGILSWSYDSQYLASRNDTMPNSLWIWEIKTMKLHSVIVLSSSLRSARWDPTHCRLVFCSSNGHVCTWDPEGLQSLSVAADITTIGLRWNPSGNEVILVGKEECCSLAL